MGVCEEFLVNYSLILVLFFKPQLYTLSPLPLFGFFLSFSPDSSLGGNLGP